MKQIEFRLQSRIVDIENVEDRESWNLISRVSITEELLADIASIQSLDTSKELSKIVLEEFKGYTEAFFSDKIIFKEPTEFQ